MLLVSKNISACTPYFDSYFENKITNINDYNGPLM